MSLHPVAALEVDKDFIYSWILHKNAGLRDCEIQGLCTCQITSSGKQCVGIPQENVPSSSGSSGGKDLLYLKLLQKFFRQ